MLSATLSAPAGRNATIRLTAGGHHVAAYVVTREDGPGPKPAADVVLDRHGWVVTGAWTHESGGISGDVWVANVEQKPVAGLDWIADWSDTAADAPA